MQCRVRCSFECYSNLRTGLCNAVRKDCSEAGQSSDLQGGTSIRNCIDEHFFVLFRTSLCKQFVPMRGSRSTRHHALCQADFHACTGAGQSQVNLYCGSLNEHSLQDFKIQNIVGSCDVKFPIRLEGLSYTHGMFSSVSVPRSS